MVMDLQVLLFHVFYSMKSRYGGCATTLRTHSAAYKKRVKNTWFIYPIVLLTHVFLLVTECQSSYSVVSVMPASRSASFLSVQVPHFPQCFSPPL